MSATRLRIGALQNGPPMTSASGDALVLSWLVTVYHRFWAWVRQRIFNHVFHGLAKTTLSSERPVPKERQHDCEPKQERGRQRDSFATSRS